ncbi:MAG: TonB-dependent receptor [Fibrobacteres bacterium]|nr:TonB-dependent receptor [Fibrobacterota bacterium]
MALRPAYLGIYAILVFAPWAFPAGAEPRVDTLELPDREGRPLPPPPAAAKSVLIPSDEDRQLRDLGDVLERMSGLHVMRTGQLGDYLGVSIRGSSEGQVNVYVNGVLKNPGGDPSLFLGDYDLSRVERIEVYKGLAPDDLPGSPMGGAINIITRQTASGQGVRAALTAGSFGSLRANGSVDASRDGLKLHAQAGRDQSEGDFTYYDDAGTEFKPGRHPEGAPRLGEGDLVRKTRRNNAHGFSEFDAAIAYAPAPSAELGLQADYSSLRKHIPSPYASVDSSVSVAAFRESDRLSARAYGRWSLPGLELGADVSGGFQGDLFVDTSMAGGAVGLGYDDDGNDYSDAAVTLTARAGIREGLTLSALASYGLTGYRYTNRFTGIGHPTLLRYTGDGKITPTWVFRRHTLQAVLGATLHLEEESAGPATAYGAAEGSDGDRGGHYSARLGYQYRPFDGFWLFLQGGNAYRIPTFFERFGDRGTLLANPDLRSEAGLNASIGAHAQSRSISLDVQGFVSDGKRIITMVTNSQFVMIYRNSGDTRTYGLEAGLSLAPRTWTRTDLDLTLQKAENLSGGTKVDDYKLIPYRPLTQASLRQTFKRGPWSLAALGYYQGLTYPNASNRPSLFDGYSHNTEWKSHCDLTLSRRGRHVLAAASVRNLFDSRDFDFFNYPLPGRSYAATLQTDF